MDRGRTMLVNTVLLTATSFLMRTVGMTFQVYLSKKIGAAGIGLFQLIMSVSMLFTTFALSGIRFATTRLVSEELGRGAPGAVRPAVRRCLTYSAIFGFVAMAVMFLLASFIGGRMIGDTRTILSLRILALSLPAFSASAVLAGYFTAVSRIVKSAAVQIAEQAIRIGVVVAALSLGRGYNIETACAAIVVGGVVGEMASLGMLYVLYLHDRKRYHGKASTAGLTGRMLGVAVPLALSAYARTALSTLQNLLVPRGFRKSGASSEKALANYGIIDGMVFPIITFPSAFFYSLAELLVPELTEAQVRGEKEKISKLTSRTLRLCLLFSLGVTAILFRFSGELGDSIYKNAEVGRYIRILSLLMPIMYLDSVTDGMLRGLGQQMHSMKYNIIDSLLSVALVYILLPRFAVGGYIFMICFTEVINFTMSIRCLRRITRLRFSAPAILKAAFCAFGAVNIAVLALRVLGLPLGSGRSSAAMHIALSAVLYLFLIFTLSCVDSEDIAWLRGLFGEKCKRVPRKFFKNPFNKRQKHV